MNKLSWIDSRGALLRKSSERLFQGIYSNTKSFGQRNEQGQISDMFPVLLEICLHISLNFVSVLA